MVEKMRILEPKIWVAVPANMKSEIPFIKFKDYVRLWSRPTGKSNLYKSIQNL